MPEKTIQITLWISPEEAAKLQRYADIAGLNRSAYIRLTALKKPIALKPTTCQMQIKPLLSSLGDEITGLAPIIGEREALRLRETVYEAYRQCIGVDGNGL